MSLVPASSRSDATVLVATDLRKSYGARPALRGLTFSLKAGHILGFLGPNGAGKTTAIRILTTILEPTSGSFEVAGISSDHPDLIRYKIGVLPESLGFHKHMTGLECLVFFGRLYGKSAAEARENGLALLKEVGLDARGRSLVGTYSRGMRQRLGIARALVHDPAVVFLDEPTLGLDPRGQQELLELIRRIARERGVGIVLCSHVLSDIEVVCDEVVILSLGQVVASGTVEDVIGRSRGEAARAGGIRIRVEPAAVTRARQVLEGLPQVKSAVYTDQNPGWLRVELVASASQESTEQHVNAMLKALISAEIAILRFETEGGRLQDAFLKLTQDAIA
jgi:ABC-2 type transport system ATP-binding protein